MIITDPDVKIALVGLPCYVQSMIGFACMFLAKLSSMHGGGIVERSAVMDLVSRLVLVYRATPVGKWHLVHLMADGLERILEILQGHKEADVAARHTANFPSAQVDQPSDTDMGQLDMIMNFDSQLMMDMGMRLGSPYHPFMGEDFLGLDGNLE